MKEMHALSVFLSIVTLVSCSSSKDTRPNIVLILTDDQDYTLGSLEAMPKTMKIFRENGVQFTNAFVTTPMCCPSRASILTGQYAHNHGSPSNIVAECYSSAWISGPEKKTMGTHLQEAGYKTIYIGKYLNQYRGKEIPPGWDVWEALSSNSKFYNYTVVHRSPGQHNKIIWRRYGDGKNDYYPDVMAKSAFNYLENDLRKEERQPVFLVLSYPGPHGPEDSAPKYRGSFPYAKAPRTPSYNVTSKDKHWGSGTNLNETHSRYIDMLHRKRLQTLLTVDDHVDELYVRLSAMNLIGETYIFFFSDHGYHLGQWAIPKGKGYPYEDDVRVPFLALGPRFPNGANVSGIALNIDLTPTFLDIAGVTVPSYMDGTSLLTLFPQTKKSEVKWRTSFMIERYKRKQNPESSIDKLDKMPPATEVPKSDETIMNEIPTPSPNDSELPVECLRQEGKFQDARALAKREYDRYVGENNCLTSEEEANCKKRKNKSPACDREKCRPLEIPSIDQYVSEDCREKIKRSPCSQESKICKVFDRDDWKTAPRWNESAFCFCYGSVSESYWCERRIEDNRNYLYCVFSSPFEEFYDLDKDPYQLTNLAYKRESGVDGENRITLQNRLKRLFECRGAASCMKASESESDDVQIASN